MVSITGDEVRELYGVDLQTLRRSCPDLVVGVVTLEGVFWQWRPCCTSLPGEDGLVDIVRSCGAEECLFLLLDGGTRESLEPHCLDQGADVTPHWIPLHRGACCLLLARRRTRPATTHRPGGPAPTCPAPWPRRRTRS